MHIASSQAGLLRVMAAATLIQLGAAWSLPAQFGIPKSSGVGGYGAFGMTAAEGRTSFISGGPPLVGKISEPVIPSVFAAPEALWSPAILVGGEVNYTFAEPRTQLFLEGNLEDAFQLDVAIHMGVRQELPDKSVLMVNGIVTPLPQRLWTDPYVEGVEREAAGFGQPGLRIRWERILGTGLELGVTARYFRFSAEQSGQWLAGEGRLDPDDVGLLDRNGAARRFLVGYGFRAGRHRFEPTLSYVRDDRDGAAMSNDGFRVRVNYRYLKPGLAVDANLGFEKRRHDESHPVYGERVSRERIGGSLTAAVPLSLFGSRQWSVWAMTEYIVEDANVDFFDSRLAAVTLGVGWRGLRQ